MIKKILNKLNPLNWFKKKEALSIEDAVSEIAKSDKVQFIFEKILTKSNLDKALGFFKGIKGLNKEELIVGLVFGLCFIGEIGWYAVPMALVTALFWAMSGAGHSKLWRRVVVPALACLLVTLIDRNLLIWASLPLATAVLSMGYGIPRHNVPGMPDDEGSVLGRFWHKINPENAGVFTKGTIYMLLALAYFPLLIKGLL